MSSHKVQILAGQHTLIKLSKKRYCAIILALPKLSFGSEIALKVIAQSRIGTPQVEDLPVFQVYEWDHSKPEAKVYIKMSFYSSQDAK